MTKIELTVYYAEPTLCLECEVEVTPDTTIGEVRGKVHKMLEKHLGEVMQDCKLNPKKLVYPSVNSVILASDTSGFGCYDNPDKILAIGKFDHLYAIVPAPRNVVSGSGSGSSDSTAKSRIEDGASLAACNTDALQSLIIQPMIKRLQELTTEKAEYQKKVEDLEGELRSMKQKEKKAVERKNKEFKALLKVEKDQMAIDLKATLDAEKAERRKEFEARVKVEMNTREQMERELRAELKLKLEKQETETATNLQNVTYALSQAILRNDLVPLRTLHVRAVLDDVQRIFADHLGLGYHSWAWRSKLADHGSGTEERIEFARSLLADVAKFQKVLHSNDAMILICQQRSRIRKNGDEIAHSYGNTAQDLMALNKELEHVLTNSAERHGMADIIDFLSTLRFPPSAPLS